GANAREIADVGGGDEVEDIVAVIEAQDLARALTHRAPQGRGNTRRHGAACTSVQGLPRDWAERLAASAATPDEVLGARDQVDVALVGLLGGMPPGDQAVVHEDH